MIALREECGRFSINISGYSFTCLEALIWVSEGLPRRVKELPQSVCILIPEVSPDTWKYFPVCVNAFPSGIWKYLLTMKRCFPRRVKPFPQWWKNISWNRWTHCSTVDVGIRSPYLWINVPVSMAMFPKRMWWCCLWQVKLVLDIHLKMFPETNGDVLSYIVSVPQMFK